MTERNDIVKPATTAIFRGRVLSAMIRDHKKILTDRKADFVVTYCREDQYDKIPILRDIEAAGYKLRLKRTYMNIPFYIYEK